MSFPPTDPATCEAEPAKPNPLAVAEPPALLAEPLPRWHTHSAQRRLTIAAALGVLGAALLPSDTHWQFRGAVGWDVGAFTLIVLTWSGILRASAAQTRLRAATEDAGRKLVMLIALGSSLFSLFSALFVIRHAKVEGVNSALWAAVGTLAVVLAWFVTHTAFALRYAHLHYRLQCAGSGLEFPGGKPPCEMDFAYFSFVIGMCFQVSDVTITRPRIRRTVLAHSLLAFAYNTVIVATVLNLVFAFMS
jgi:uncharacterized membrane protein